MIVSAFTGRSPLDGVHIYRSATLYESVRESAPERNTLTRKISARSFQWHRLSRIEKIKSFRPGAAFESWMRRNHARETELWLRVYKKGSGVATISTAQALDVALCWGWIGGIRKPSTRFVPAALHARAGRRASGARSTASMWRG